MSIELRNAIRAVNRSLIVSAVGVVSLAGLSSTAQAQTAASGNQMEEIVITGYRGSLQQSLNMKRNSDAIIDAITAEDIGKFPDMNVAESLQRVPGVTVQRQFGEGAAVSIRGTGNELTLTTLNGQNVASTGWFVLEPAKRSFNYELLPSELVGNIEVYKTSQADIAEGGVGGTVTINTLRPMQLKPLTARATMEYQDQDDSDEKDPLYSGLVSWHDDGNRFGVMVSGVRQDRSLQRQGNEAFWEWGAGPVGFEQDRERSALTGTLQFRPTENLDIVFNAMSIDMQADNTNYAMWLTQGNTSWSGVPVPADCLLGATPVCGPLNGAYLQARPREATMESDVRDLKIEYTGTNYTLGFQGGHTESSGGTDFEMVVNPAGDYVDPIPGGTYDFRGDGQTWDLNGYDLANYVPTTLAMGTGAAFNKTPKTDEEDYLQADFEYKLDYGPLTAIKTGVKTSKHNTESRQFFFDQDPTFDPTIPSAGVLDGHIDVGANGMEIVKLDADALKDWAKSSIIGMHEDFGSHSEIDEDNDAAYVMLKFATDSVRGNLGVRYISTDATSTYYVSGVKTESDDSYSDWLPSLNVAWSVTDEWVVRFAAARAIARPQYVDMYVNPSAIGTNDETPNNQFWVTGNVGLKPFTSDQVDLGAEWYFGEHSMVGATLFYKNVSNFVTIHEYHADSADIPFGGVLKPEEIANGWQVQEKDNGEEADVQGIELQYQQEFGYGFGAQASYTYTDTDTDETTFTDGNPFLSDSSDDTYNVTGYWENDMFQARLSYVWRSEYMLRESGAYGNRINDDYGTLDFSGKWLATDHFTVSLDVINITEEDAKQYGNNTALSPNSGFQNGFPIYEYETARRVVLGVSAKF